MPNTATQGLLSSVTKAQDWLKTRLNNIDIFDEHYQAEARTNPFYALGPIFYLVWFVVMLTGLVLIMWYIPTKAGAYNSILDIQHHIPLGNLFRGVHKYGADAMIIAATMRLFRMFLAADYKPGREFNIAIGLITLLLSMYSGLTGYLLIWNQRAFWATKVFATFPTYMDQFPVMGDFYLPLVKSLHLGWNTAEFLLGAGGAITQETITRFFSLHLAFSLIPLIFVELYFYKNSYVRMPINWTKRLIIVGMLIVTSIALPAAIGGRSNPDVTPLPILSDWYFLGLYQMYKYLEPVVATEITLLIPLSVMLLPFIDVAITGPEKDIMKRPLMLMTTIMGGVNWVVFSFLIIFNIANIHSDPPWWRDFFYLMINAGIIWQLWLMFKGKDVRTHLANASAAVLMGVVAAIQSALALVYYFMARTEMFLSPLTQAWTYAVFRPFMGQHADASETLVRAALKAKVDNYWDYANVIGAGTPLSGPSKQIFAEAGQLAQQTTPLDFIFQLIHTFQKDMHWLTPKLSELGYTKPNLEAVIANPAAFGISSIPDLKYHGLVDYMLSNRWTFDYVTFVDRMTPGLVPPYPIEVPPVDWAWMIAGPVTLLACLYAHKWCKKQAGAQPAKSGEPEKAAVSL